MRKSVSRLSRVRRDDELTITGIDAIAVIEEVVVEDVTVTEAEGRSAGVQVVPDIRIMSSSAQQI